MPWLDPGIKLKEVLAMLAPYPDNLMDAISGEQRGQQFTK